MNAFLRLQARVNQVREEITDQLCAAVVRMSEEELAEVARILQTLATAAAADPCGPLLNALCRLVQVETLFRSGVQLVEVEILRGMMGDS